jgi:hypothetical protein
MEKIKIGMKVKTIHNTIGEVTGIYNGEYPYVVTIYKNGMPYSSDYSATQLTITL